EPIRDPATGQVVGRQLDLHPVARQDPDEVHPHLARDMGEHPVAVVELHPEHRVRQRLHHFPLDLDRVVLRLLARLIVRQLAPTATHQAAPASTGRVSTSGSPSVTATVSSKCAARLPSSVTAVQRSFNTRTPQCPMVTMGSMARTIPARSSGPLPGSPKLGTWGSS